MSEIEELRAEVGRLEDNLSALLCELTGGAREFETWRQDMGKRYERAGLEHRYDVKRVGDTEGKHDDCRYFVLDPQHDPIARIALMWYSHEANARGFIPLSNDLNRWLREFAPSGSDEQGNRPATPDANGVQDTKGGE